MSDLGAILETGAAAGIELAASKLAEGGHPAEKCPNCGAPMIGPYCAVCGQERDTHRRSVYGLVGDLIEDIVSFDSRILRTARALLLQPGELPEAFREGRTRRYVPALRLYFFVSLIFFLVLGVAHIAILQLQVVATPVKVIYDAHGNAFLPNPAYDKSDAGDSDMKFMPKLIPLAKKDVPGPHFTFSTKSYFFAPIGAHKSALSPAVMDRLKKQQPVIVMGNAGKEGTKQNATDKAVEGWIKTHVFGGIQRLAADPAELNEPLTNWIPRVLFLLLPLYALLLAAFYWRQRKKFFLVDHLIFSLSVHTFTFVALLAAAGLAQLVAGEWVFWFLLASIGVYVLLSLKRFYGQSWFWTGLKFVFISGIYTLFFLLPSLGAVIAYGFLYS